MTQTTTEKSAASTSGTPGQMPDIDPFAHLHRMSTTAGLGSQDYVAINTRSVAAIVLGVASILAVFFPVLLLMPIAGLVVAIVAHKQIRSSNGTQSGLLLAWAGFTFSIACLLILGGSKLHDVLDQRSQRFVVRTLLDDLSHDVASHDYKAAYALFSTKFSERVPEPKFEGVWRGLEDRGYVGKIQKIDWSGQMMFFTDPLSSNRFARILVDIYFDKSTTAHTFELLLRGVGSRWLIEDFSNLFPAEPLPGGP